MEDDAWLARRKARLQAGPMADDFRLPDEVRVMDDNGVLRLVGPAVAIADLRGEFQKLERSPSGSAAHVGAWTLRVEDDLLMPAHEREIVLPWHAWGIAACVLSDVAYGYEPNPLDFSRTGYLTVEDADTGQHLPWPSPDIGVVVEGDLIAP